MRNYAIALCSCLLFTISSNSQISVAPIVGYQVDLQNNNRFKLINTAVQVGFQKGAYYELIFHLQKTWPVAWQSSDSAFSANPSVPQFSTALKTIRPGAFSITVGHRVGLLGVGSNHVFSVVAHAGLTFQRIRVFYSYDKENYTVLNPDRTINADGFYLNGGFEYARQMKTGRILAQVLAAAEPVARTSKYPSSFDFIAPISFNLGYSLPVRTDRDR